MKVKKGVIIQKMGNAYVAYDNESSTMHELNETGYLILSGLEKGREKEEILTRIITKFRVDEKEASRDFEKFVQLLIKKDLIVGRK